MYLNLFWQVLNGSQLVLTKPIACQRRQKFTSTCVQQTQPMRSRRQNAYKIVLTKNLPWQRRNKMYLNMSWANPLIPVRTEIHRNMCWSTPLLPARTQNTYQIMLTKRLSYQIRHKMHIKSCWPSCSNSSEHTLCIRTCSDQKHYMPGKTQNSSQQVLNVSQHVLTKPIACQREQNFFSTFGMGGDWSTHVEIHFVSSLACWVLVNACWDESCVLAGMGWFGQQLLR